MKRTVLVGFARNGRAAGKLGRSLLARFFTFARALAGNVAIIFALAAVPIVIAGGAAVDYSRAFVVQQRLTAALDAAALAVGASTKTDFDELNRIAQDYFKANYPAEELGVPGELHLSIDGETVRMNATAELETALMGIVGIHEMDVYSDVEVTKEKNALEVALVLDNTGSMNSYSKIDALKQAARDLVDIMFGDEDTPELLKFALVPFSASVNVGAQNRNSGWIDVNGANSLHGINFDQGNPDPSLKNVLGAYDDLSNKEWNGCVEARPTPYDTEDTPPSQGNGDTLWVPYFAPDEPDRRAARRYGYWYGNDYLDDQLGGGNNNLDQRQEHRPKYIDQPVSGSGPHFNCENQPILPLTNNKAVLLDAIDRMNAAGSTVIPIGLAWGWRVLSPGEPFTQGASYSDDSVKKVIILLTDGQNDIGSLPNHNRSWYNGYGYVAQGRLGTTNASAAHDELDRRTALLCDNVKQADVLVYSITFRVNSTSVRNLMRGCASSTDMYFDSPSNAQLRETFKEIAKQLGKLRISK